MTAAARHARSGAVTVAVRQAMTFAGHVEPGDVLGAVEGDFVLVGADLYDVAVEVFERLLGGGGELVTVVSGRAASSSPSAVSSTWLPTTRRSTSSPTPEAGALPRSLRGGVMATITLQSRISAVAGTKAKKLTEGLGVETVGDLLTHYPRTLHRARPDLRRLRLRRRGVSNRRREGAQLRPTPLPGPPHRAHGLPVGGGGRRRRHAGDDDLLRPQPTNLGLAHQPLATRRHGDVRRQDRLEQAHAHVGADPPDLRGGPGRRGGAGAPQRSPTDLPRDQERHARGISSA